MAQPQGGVNNSWRTWHSDADIAERKRVLLEILRFFERRRPAIFQQWGDRLPEFVKRLEDGLYRSARSKEEYEDLNTLEQRLHDVARRMVQRPGGQPGAPQGNAVPDGMSEGMSYEQLVQLEDVKVTVPKHVVDGLRTCAVAKASCGDSCAICQVEYTAGEHQMHLPCKHCFHTECVTPWLLECSKKCPVCKTEVC